MQKVVGSSPIIRFFKQKPRSGAVLLARVAPKAGCCKRFGKRFEPRRPLEVQAGDRGSGVVAARQQQAPERGGNESKRQSPTLSGLERRPFYAGGAGFVPLAVFALALEP
jgi:hypothetical protein